LAAFCHEILFTWCCSPDVEYRWNTIHLMLFTWCWI
jgi:hypothetical protein